MKKNANNLEMVNRRDKEDVWDSGVLVVLVSPTLEYWALLHNIAYTGREYVLVTERVSKIMIMLTN